MERPSPPFPSAVVKHVLLREICNRTVHLSHGSLLRQEFWMTKTKSFPGGKKRDWWFFLKYLKRQNQKTFLNAGGCGQWEKCYFILCHLKKIVFFSSYYFFFYNGWLNVSDLLVLKQRKNKLMWSLFWQFPKASGSWLLGAFALRSVT